MTNLRRLGVVLLGASLLACGGAEDEPAAPEPTPEPVRTMTPMQPTGFRVEWGMPGVPSPIKAGSAFAVGVAVKNSGDQLWVDPRHADSQLYASGAVRLAYRWWGSDGKRPYRDYGAERGDLIAPIHPGQTAVLAVPVTAPSEPGSYKLQLELLQENVSFFENMGGSILLVPVTVKADPAAKR